MLTGPRWLYLHGFASGPNSTKGVAIEKHYAAQGIEITRLDLRRPSLEHLRLSAMIEHVQQAIGGEHERAVLWGSSLGGLCAARVAERDARVCALVLLAPAFRMAERWRKRSEAEWQKWRRTGWLEIDDYAEKHKARVDYGFAEDVERVDVGWPDVRVPTLIIHGRNDDTVDVELSREWARGKRWVRLVEADDGHELVAALPLITREADAFLRPFGSTTAS